MAQEHLTPDNHPLLSVRDLRVRFETAEGPVEAVRGVSFDVNRGEVVAVVGESGSGKSLTALGIMGLISGQGSVSAGSVTFGGRDLTKLTQRAMSDIRGREIAMIFQDPLVALNPVLTIGRQIGEAMGRHEGVSKAVARRRSVDLLELVGIPSPHVRVDQYPHQLSGGMCQRVMIASALACGPSLLIADEPTTALDVTVQAQIMRLLRDIQRQAGMAMMLITHDLGLVAGAADQVNVMYAGRIVESGRVNDVFASPSHPYTIGLLNSMPRINSERSRRMVSIPGSPPQLGAIPSGCAFEPRCRSRVESCQRVDPALESVGGSHARACIVPVDAIWGGEVTGVSHR